MADIFISYSSYDREKANTLAKELRTNGYEVWMDNGGIGGAQDWSSEIVEALNKAKTILFLVSKDSVTSHNCAKEIHLASEKHKNILPIVLEDTPLPVLFEYPLAGLQRVHYEHTEAILEAIEILKGGKTVMDAMLSQSRIDDGTIHLAVLPFEDQSPGQDNEWFANGMVDELIDTLGSLEQLKVNPRGDVVYYKKNRPKHDEIASDLKCRYIVEGSVSKSGEKIRIRVLLTDTAEHKQVWSEKYDGTFEDIFDIQESVAKKVAASLTIILTPEEERKIVRKPTENADAYELYLKAFEYIDRSTKSAFANALALYEEAIRLDPLFVEAHLEIANISLWTYRIYTRSSELLDHAREAAEKAKELGGETAEYYWVLSSIARQDGEYESALGFAMKSAEVDPKFSLAYDALGFAYKALGKQAEAVKAWEENVRLRENNKNAHFSLLINLHELGDTEQLLLAADRAVPIFERHIRFNPDDFNARVQLANVLSYAGKDKESVIVADELALVESLDGSAHYNLACVYLTNNSPERGMSHLFHSVAKGFNNIENFRNDPDLAPLRGTAEFEELMKELEERVKSN